MVCTNEGRGLRGHNASHLFLVFVQRPTDEHSVTVASSLSSIYTILLYCRRSTCTEPILLLGRASPQSDLVQGDGQKEVHENTKNQARNVDDVLLYNAMALVQTQKAVTNDDREQDRNTHT